MWFIFSLITIVMWGGSDLFSKLGSDPRDKYSHIRMTVMVGAVMGIHAIITIITEYCNNGVTYVPQSFITYLPISLMYIGSMVIGYAGLRYIELSISSPICNSSGAIVVLLCYFILHQQMEALQLLAVILIFVGIFLLSVFEKHDEDKERLYRGEVIEKKYQVGFIAILLPILYCIIDGLGTFSDAFVLDMMSNDPIYQGEAEFQANTSYELMFLLCAIGCFIFLKYIKKLRFSLKEEKEKGIAGICETAGQFFYIYALADNAIVAAPMISSYCVFSVILSRIILKEKLTWKQYLVIGVVAAGIVIMGAYDS
jgi:drug/metabolite transporter (DMT)-like permease